MNRERALAFTVVRLGSHRLVGKHLRPIGDRSVLDWVVRGLESSRELDQVVLATTSEQENDPLEAFAESRGIACYRHDGDPEEVTTRLRRAAEEHGADICVMVSADCPLVDGRGIDALIRALRDSPRSDIVDLRRKDSGLTCSMSGISVARLRCWQLADDLSDSPELKRHQFPVIRRQEHRFAVLPSPLPDEYYGSPRRLSVDTWADLDFMNALHDRLIDCGERFELGAATRLLEREPALALINAHVHQRSIEETERRVLFVADAGGEIGFGHLMRCRELALQLTERTGRQCVFLVDDEEAAERVEERGMRAHWGALERPARMAPGDRTAESARSLAEGCDFTVVDLFGKRTLDPGWQARLGSPVVVVDRCEEWAREANLIVVPGVTLPENWPSPASPKGPGAPMVGGGDFVILRREIRYAALRPRERDIDVLAYLYDEEERAALRELGRRCDLTVHVLERRSRDFPELLARSRLFVSGFGIAFYEALALGTRPVAWPLSPEHARDARRFFQAFGLEPVVIERASDLGILVELLAGEEPRLPTLVDGTPRIVELLDRALHARGPAAGSSTAALGLAR